MPPENQTATASLPSELFATNNAIVAPGANPTTASTTAPDLEDALPPSADNDADAEETLWEGRYSSRNFLGRASLGGLWLAAFVALFLATWGLGHAGLTSVTYVAGAGLILYLGWLGFKYFRIRGYYHYRLTERRLFLRTGVFQRRVDQVELIRIKDLFVRESLVGSWLGVGNVVLISSEPTLPKAFLLGIEQPRQVMDLIWVHTRKELDRGTKKVKSV